MWRYPGKPYNVKLDGLTFECHPLSRGKRKEVFEQMSSFADSEDRLASIDALYELAPSLIASIEGQADVAGFIDCQSPSQLIRLLATIAQGGSITDAETKNSESSSPALS